MRGSGANQVEIGHSRVAHVDVLRSSTIAAHRGSGNNQVPGVNIRLNSLLGATCLGLSM